MTVPTRNGQRLARRDHAWLFQLRIVLGSHLLLVDAYEHVLYPPGSHTRVDIEARLVHHEARHDDCKSCPVLHELCGCSVKREEVIWERGRTWVGVPAHQSIDGDYAKAAALSLLSMRPGDTDEEFFADWSERQLAFAETWGEDLEMERHARFGSRFS